ASIGLVGCLDHLFDFARARGRALLATGPCSLGANELEPVTHARRQRSLAANDSPAERSGRRCEGFQCSLTANTSVLAGSIGEFGAEIVRNRRTRGAPPNKSPRRSVQSNTWMPVPEPTRRSPFPVIRPVRGFIDVVFDSERRNATVATEVETRLDRLEQQIRRADEKARSLPSS